MCASRIMRRYYTCVTPAFIRTSNYFEALKAALEFMNLEGLPIEE